MPTKIMAIGHQKNTGKSTFANFLVTALRMQQPGSTICVKSFAQGVKDVSHHLFAYLGLEDATFYEKNYTAKEVPLACGWTPRSIWIKVGNDMRKVDNFVWANEALQSDCDYLILPDLRFLDEAVAVKELGGQCIKIDRDVPRSHDQAETSLLGYDGWDTVIKNDKGLNNLYTEAEQWVKK